MTARRRPVILVVEDETDILDVVQYNLKKNGFDVFTATTGEDGLRVADRETPDLVLLDLMLPGLDGHEICRRLRASERTREIPVIMLTARSTEADVVSGLTLGADDYITKPFRPAELVARVKAVLRRREPEEAGGVIKLGDVAIDAKRHEVEVAGARISLTLSEFKLLKFLIQHPGFVYSRGQLLDAVVGPDVFVTSRNIDVHVAALRKKLGDAGRMIVTVRGVGYRIETA